MAPFVVQKTEFGIERGPVGPLQRASGKATRSEDTHIGINAKEALNDPLFRLAGGSLVGRSRPLRPKQQRQMKSDAGERRLERQQGWLTFGALQRSIQGVEPAAPLTNIAQQKFPFIHDQPGLDPTSEARQSQCDEDVNSSSPVLLDLSAGRQQGLARCLREEIAIGTCEVIPTDKAKMLGCLLDGVTAQPLP